MKPRRDSNDLSRRKFMVSATQAGAAIGLSQLLSNDFEITLAQNQIRGKERLIVRSLRPEDLETPLSLLDSWITPNDLFYVRHHSYAASVDEKAGKEWTIKVDGEVERPMSMTIDELKKMPKVTVTVTLECAGNGRAFFDPPVAGIQWEKGAVGTARWAGARLADVLKKAGVKSIGKYVLLDGADKPIGKMPDFIRNVPIEKALHTDTILAYEMNGEPLPALHGYPLRAIVPGWEGAYAVKWLNHIEVIDKEHDGFFVKTAYRYPNRPIAPGASVDPKDMIPLTGLIVKSFISSPLEGAKIKPGKVRVGGFAWAGESSIAKVDLSLDNGITWIPARLGEERERYAWQSFEHTFDITAPGSYLITSRATDDKGHTQPVVPQWNPSGYLWNVIDKVRINIDEASVGPQPAVSKGLPNEDRGKEIFENKCIVCHEADLSQQQRLSREGWGREVDKMIRWGANVTEAEKDPLLDYLVRNYGPPR
jgi:DMSO/TMAO reductase YedYZ molybdopterin-dependent catalytic subunit